MIIKAIVIASALWVSAGAAIASPVPERVPSTRFGAISANRMLLAKDAHDNDHGGHERGGHNDRGGDHDRGDHDRGDHDRGGDHDG